MKKIAIILFASLVNFAASAQSVQFGVRGGLNISKESDFVFGTNVSVSSDMTWRAGVSIGGLVNVPVCDKWEVEADLTYSMLGYKDRLYYLPTATNQDEYKKYTVTSHYLTLPVTAKFYPVDGFYLELGPQFGYLLSKKDNVENIGSTSTYDNDNKNFDFAILGGIGYKFSNDIFVNARYIHSLTGTNNCYDGGNNRNIQISLGYLF